ncbi:lipid-binding protein [Parapedobacter indicus]|uniref:Lipid-binding putative hydrolase n=1 Tax=Parapedobacter indicus TaxID=1477437 RepID=A0A1I3DG89_9SPHI|nr:lipid-binding protein [Parapedobacter indicus]PPL04656.1 lipid-binding putative hydrolase [Parapedobacter indicus]SFH85568.1 Lipid-binding putative hydrolase [Parapedobacter indicus]
MKKIFLLPLLYLFGTLLISSCEKDDIGGTNGEKTAGEWYVTVVAVDEAGNVVYEDDELFGIGHFHLDTYNTVANDPNEMWIDDNTNFWETKGKISVDPNALTFSGEDVQNEYYDSQFTVTNGKILLKAATTPSGMPADSIVFNLNFSDDDYPKELGFSSYLVSGYRYTGFAGDE